jgi:hypothetical protein
MFYCVRLCPLWVTVNIAECALSLTIKCIRFVQSGKDIKQNAALQIEIFRQAQ